MTDVFLEMKLVTNSLINNDSVIKK